MLQETSENAINILHHFPFLEGRNLPQGQSVFLLSRSYVFPFRRVSSTLSVFVGDGERTNSSERDNRYFYREASLFIGEGHYDTYATQAEAENRMMLIFSST